METRDGHRERDRERNRETEQEIKIPRGGGKEQVRKDDAAKSGIPPEASVLDELTQEGDDALGAILVLGGQVDLVAKEDEPAITLQGPQGLQQLRLQDAGTEAKKRKKKVEHKHPWEPPRGPWPS